MGREEGVVMRRRRRCHRGVPTSLRDALAARRGLLVACLVACLVAALETVPAVLAGAPTALAADAADASPSGAAAIAHRIGVRVSAGSGELFDVLTDERFVPRGANLIRLDGGNHSTLDVGRYDPVAAESALERMSAEGYNVVRVFLNTYPGGLPGASAPLSGAYLDNMADLLARAAGHGILVLFTLDWLPESDAYGFTSDPGIENVNSMYLSRGGLEANARFFGDLARGLIDRGARLDALLAYELRNELYFTELYPPFSLRSGGVTTANGRSYDMAVAAEKVLMLEENLVHWVDTMRAAIRAVDPTALVTVGFFQPKGPNTSRVGDDRLIETEAVILRSTADLIDLHGYPGGELNLRQIVENFKLPAVTAKPILMGEFGSEHQAHATADDAVRALVEWQVESCRHGFDGWLLWTWDSLEQPEFWNALDADGLIGEALSPLVRPDPCSVEPLAITRELARSARVRASSTAKGYAAGLARDGLAATRWNASRPPPQAITLQLEKPSHIELIRLLVAQDPPGRSRHVVAVRRTGGVWRTIAVLEGTTRDGQWLTIEPRRPIDGVRQLRITTTSIAGDLWPAWWEISILGR